TDSEGISTHSRTFMQDAKRTIFRSKQAIIALILLLIVMIMSLVGPHMNKYGYNDQDLTRVNMPPKIKMFENISWLGFDGTLKSTFKGETVDDAVKKATDRYNTEEEFVDVK